MPVIIDYPLSSTFAGVNSLQSMGTIDTGDNLPNGIPDRMVIENGAMKTTITDSDPDTATAIRSELTAPADAYAERWYSFEFMVPSDFSPLLDRITLMQIHDTPDGGDGAKWIPFTMDFMPEGHLAIYVPSHTLPSEGATGKIVAFADCPRDEWIHACLHVDWKTTAVGFREFYLNGKKLYGEYNLATMYDDVTGCYFKCGVYDASHNARFGSVTAYHRNVKIWSGNDGFATVLGQNPLTPLNLLDA